MSMARIRTPDAADSRFGGAAPQTYADRSACRFMQTEETRMKKAISLLLTLTLLLALAVPALAVSEGDTVPNWSATTIDGKTINQSTYSGKTQLLVFYRATLTSSGSGMCYNSNSLIEDLAQSGWIGTSGLQIIAFDVDGNSADAVSAYKQKYAPNTNKIIFALNGSSILGSMFGYGNTLACCAIVQNNMVVSRWASAHSADFCAQRLSQVMDLDGYNYTYVDAKVTGTFCYDYARQQLEMVNAFRTGSEAWYWNSDNSSKTTYAEGQLGALRIDAKLEQIAMARARELALCFSHTRPNGDSFLNFNMDGVYSYGENIAYGYTTPSSVFTAWREDDYAYNGQGHRRNMLNPNFTAVGFGCFYHQGRYYWAQEFGYSYSGAAPATAKDQEVTGYVQYFTGFLGDDYWSDEGNCPTSQYTPTFPTISTQPSSKTVAAGAAATFKVVASGGGLSYQWQYSKDNGTTWKDKDGAVSATYKVTAKASYDGILYRCKVSNSVGTVYSGEVKLTVTAAASKPSITTQPTAKTAAEGATATFKVVASGTGLSYQWQYSTNGGSTWKNKSGATSATYKVTAKASYDGILYRCKVSNSAGSVYSNKVKLTVTSSTGGPVITSVKGEKIISAGVENIKWTAAASGGSGTLQYRFCVYKDGTLVQKSSYGTVKTLIYPITSAGTYKVKVYVKDASGTAVSKTSASITIS